MIRNDSAFLVARELANQARKLPEHLRSRFLDEIQVSVGSGFEFFGELSVLQRSLSRKRHLYIDVSLVSCKFL
jgi:hypothetical protein